MSNHIPGEAAYERSIEDAWEEHCREMNEERMSHEAKAVELRAWTDEDIRREVSLVSYGGSSASGKYGAVVVDADDMTDTMRELREDYRAEIAALTTHLAERIQELGEAWGEIGRLDNKIDALTAQLEQQGQGRWEPVGVDEQSAFGSVVADHMATIAYAAETWGQGEVALMRRVVGVAEAERWEPVRPGQYGQWGIFPNGVICVTDEFDNHYINASLPADMQLMCRVAGESEGAE